MSIRMDNNGKLYEESGQVSCLRTQTRSSQALQRGFSFCTERQKKIRDRLRRKLQQKQK